jgi:hypothetical protein
MHSLGVVHVAQSSARPPIGAAAHQLPLSARALGNPKHDLPLHESLDLVVTGAVATHAASALAGVTERNGRVRALQFLLTDGWILDVPMSDKLVEQLRQIIGTFEAGQ